MMGLLRLIFLVFLGYALYRLIMKAPVGMGKVRGGAEPRQGPGGEIAPADDVLMEDPVCHTYIPKKQAVTHYRETKPIYFCSEKCRDAYLGNKEQHVNGERS